MKIQTGAKMASQELSADQILEIARKLRYKWKDEIPAQIIHNEGDYKCRNAWFAAVELSGGICEQRGYLSEKSIEFYKRFCDYIKTTEKSARPTTESDIMLGNVALDGVIRDLEARADAPSQGAN